METSQLLTDTFVRIRELYVGAVQDLDLETAHRRPGGVGNPVVWLLWHTARVEDDHVAGISGGPQAWHDGWAERFSLPFDESAHGYGHTSADVDAVKVDRLELLVDYHGAVHQQSMRYLEGVDAAELDRVVDRQWDPPVTAGTRLVSVLSDCLQHLGQVYYVKGLPATQT